MPLGALAVPGRVTGAQPQHPGRILELSFRAWSLLSEEGQTAPKVLLTSLLRARKGGNCKCPAAIYGGRFPLQNPESRRAGLGP